MIPARTPRKRPYIKSNMYRRQPPSPEVQQAIAELRAQLIADKGGEETISTAERILIDLVVDAYLKKQSTGAFLLTLPSLVDKRHRQVSVQRAALEKVESYVRSISGSDDREQKVG